MSGNISIFFKPIGGAKIDEPKFRKIIRAEAMSIAADMMLDLLVTTATWKRNVKFKRIVDAKADILTIIVGSDDEIWGYVNSGTPEHIILPRNKPVLRFRNVYKAKTLPGVLSAFPGGSSGEWRSSKGLIHPGIQPRKFDEALQKKWEKPFQRRIEAAITDALAQAWVHNINRK